MKRMLKNIRGQGTTEYIVILGIVVAIAVAVVWRQLRVRMEGGVQNIGNSITQVTNPGQNQLTP